MHRKGLPEVKLSKLSHTESERADREMEGLLWLYTGLE